MPKDPENHSGASQEEGTPKVESIIKAKERIRKAAEQRAVERKQRADEQRTPEPQEALIEMRKKILILLAELKDTLLPLCEKLKTVIQNYLEVRSKAKSSSQFDEEEYSAYRKNELGGLVRKQHAPPTKI